MRSQINSRVLQRPSRQYPVMRAELLRIAFVFSTSQRTILLCIHFAAQKRPDVRRGATDDSAADSDADAQIGRRPSASDACT
eukprot:6193089-Pleurochrysis_carterae.AAC.6